MKTHARQSSPWFWTLTIAIALAGALAVALSGCAGEADPRPGRDPSLVNGNVTTNYPHVGQMLMSLSSCTATLITPTVAITAAHCVRYKSCEEPDCNMNGFFRVIRGANDIKPYRIVRVRAFQGPLGPYSQITAYLRDVALIELDQPVPANVATPAGLADRYPAVGAPLKLFGYGCSDRCNMGLPPDVPTKRFADVTYGAVTKHLCPGDSGGPTFDAQGRVVRINSAFQVKAGDDIYGDAVALYDAIQQQLTTWQNTPRPVGSSVDCSERKDCYACASRKGCGWSASRGRCFSGGVTGSIGGFSGGSDWVWSRDSCPGPVNLPPNQLDPQESCSQAQSCSACAALSGCGWSEPAQRCVTGDPMGPDDTQLGKVGWFYAPYCCPGGDKNPPAPTTCDWKQPFACGPQTSSYCLSGSASCGTCPIGTFNCDGVDDCECQGGCNGTQCAGETTPPTPPTPPPSNTCDPTAAMACGDAGVFCGQNLQCESCPAGMSNCDGVGDCECQGGCNGAQCAGATPPSPPPPPAGCSPIDPNACAKTQYCNVTSGACESCSAGKTNCDGVGMCECAHGCDGAQCKPATTPPPPPPATCSIFDPQACGGDPSRYCDSATGGCVSCPAGTQNCNGTLSCECQSGCSGGQCKAPTPPPPPPPPTGTSFSDVPASHPYHAAISHVTKQGWMESCGGSKFCPTGSLHRAHAVRSLVRRKFGESFGFSQAAYFNDVPSGYYAFKYVQKAVEAKIVAGCSPTMFCPTQSVDRAVAATLLIKTLYGTSFSYKKTPHFSDMPSSHWAFPYVQKLYDEGITAGCGNGKFCPTGIVSREQWAQLLYSAK